MSRDVRKWLSLDPPFNRAMERLCVLVAQFAVRRGMEGRSVYSKRVAQKHLRLNISVRDVGPFQPLAGVHPGLPQPHAPKFSRFRACSASTSR